MTFGVQTVSETLADGTSEPNMHALTFAINAGTASVGFGGSGFSTNITDLAAAILVDSGLTNAWFVGSATLTSAKLITPVLSLSATTLSLSLNGAARGASPINFSSSPLTVAGVTFNQAGKEGQASAIGATINLLGVLTGSADLTYSSQTVDADVNNDGNTDLFGAHLVTASLANPNISIGSGSFGLTVNSGTIGIADLTPAAAAGETREWTAIQASGLGASMTLGGFASATASNVNVDFNNATGALSTTDATPLDWAKDVGTDNAGALTPAPVIAGPTTINLSGGRRRSTAI